MLMRCIDETGSVSAAARRMRMSHSRSAKLVSELNMLAKEPLIATKSGGEAGGGAKLTILGQQVLTLYGELEEAVSAAAQAPLARLEKAILDV